LTKAFLQNLAVRQLAKYSGVLWKVKARYHMHISPFLGATLNQKSTIHKLLPYLMYIPMLSSHLRQGLPSSVVFSLPHQKPACVYLLPQRVLCPIYLILLELDIVITQKLLRVQKLWSCSFLHSATPPSGPGPPHYRGFTITFRHTTLDRTPLDEESAWCTRPPPPHLATRLKDE
jgi:hypothetical protein